ncbi:MAG: sugar phosphate isomerase/epimerase [Kiritimatiellae bacterium]|nr:sugar phosphate isomerase/epimerase [Kiritimatiellia bacterium]
MVFALSTRWNAGRHSSGEEMLAEILDLGITHVELGYDLTVDLVPGVLNMVRQGAVVVQSVHNFCPVPVGAPEGHPELFTLASRDRRIWEGAVSHTKRSIEFCAEVGANVVVLHAGNVQMRKRSHRLAELCAADRQYSTRYDKVKLKLQVVREKKVTKQLEALYRGIERLLPLLESSGVRLGIENLPTWESIPTEPELVRLFDHFASDRLCYWHDIGHGQVRENLGFIGHVRWLEKLQPRLAGLHIHDVGFPVYDHLMPPRGDINFLRFKKFAELDIMRVFEPAPRTPKEDLAEGIRVVREIWERTEPST